MYYYINNNVYYIIIHFIIFLYNHDELNNYLFHDTNWQLVHAFCSAFIGLWYVQEVWSAREKRKSTLASNSRVLSKLASSVS